MFAHERALSEERGSAREAMKVVLDKLGRGEALSVEDRTALDGANKRIGEIEGELRSIAEARALSDAAASSAPEAPSGTAAERRERDFSAFVRTGAISPELRAAGEATNSAGGYLVPPGWWQRLQVALKAFGGTAADFTRIETESGQPMQWATVNPTAVVGALIGENVTVSEQDYVFGQGTLSAYMYTSGVQQVSFQLSNDSAFDLDQFVAARVGESLGRALAAAAISGTGSAQPLGVVTALAAAPSSGTVGSTLSQVGGYVTLAAAGAVKNFAGSTTELISNTINPTTILNMIACVDPAYRALGSKFYMNDMQLLGLRAQVDSNGRPLVNLIDGLRGDLPITHLMGYETVVDNNIPNLTASTAGGPIFGHLGSAMVHRVVTQSGLMRLNERYADALQIGFIGYNRWDIRSNDTRAAVVVKAAAT
jgi:HK97 family phage major capsid protein